MKHIKKCLSLLPIIILFTFSCPYPDNPLNPFYNNKKNPDKPFLVIINGISENLSFINKRGQSLFTSNVLLGLAPNQIIKNNDDIYIINSNSNSIMVFDYNDFSIKKEFSVETGQNPYKACIIENNIYISAYLTHKLLKYSLAVSKKNEINFVDIGSYKPYPLGVVNWNDYIFIACMYSTDGTATNTRDPGRIAVYNASNDILTGYIEAGAKNTNALYLDDNILYIISSGSYDVGNGGFQEDGIIESIQLNDVSDDLGSNPATISGLTVTSDSSFGALCIYNTKAWAGNLGNGTLRQYDVSGDTWTQIETRTFPGNSTLAYIPDIKYDPVEDRIYVTEFNGNYLYILYPDTLLTKKSFKSTISTLGDAQFMLMCE